MKKNNLILAQEWFYRADEDELSCVALLKEKISPSNACFLAQQCAEKYLKGMIIFSGKEIDKIHDLKKLANLLENDFPGIIKFMDDFYVLNRCYIPSRYPGGFAENFDWQDAKTALEIAKKIKKFVLDQIIP